MQSRTLLANDPRGPTKPSILVTEWEAMIDKALHTELWTSWASLLRSYCAAHGLNAPQHAVVEVSAAEITLRVGARWLRFTPDSLEGTNLPKAPFHLNEEGTVSLTGNEAEEMDVAAEQFARDLLMGTGSAS